MRQEKGQYTNWNIYLLHKNQKGLTSCQMLSQLAAICTTEVCYCERPVAGEALTQIKLKIFSLLKRYNQPLCQAAWTAIRLDPKVDEDWLRTKGKGKERGKKAAVAIMRRLAIRMWHTMFECGTPEELVGSGRPGMGHVTSAQAPQKGPPLSSSPSLQPQEACAG